MGYHLDTYFVQNRIKTRNTSQCVSCCCAPSTQLMFRKTAWWTGLSKGSLRPSSSSTPSGWNFLLWNASKINKCLFLFCGVTHVWKRTAASIFIFWLRSGWDFSSCVLFGCCHRHKGSCDRGGVAQTPNVSSHFMIYFSFSLPLPYQREFKVQIHPAGTPEPKGYEKEWFLFTVCYTTVCCWRFLPLLQLT